MPQPGAGAPPGRRGTGARRRGTGAGPENRDGTTGRARKTRPGTASGNLGARPDQRGRPEQPAPTPPRQYRASRRPATPCHWACGVQNGSRPLRPTARSNSEALSATGTTGPKMPPPRSPSAAASARKAYEARNAAGSGT